MAATLEFEPHAILWEALGESYDEFLTFVEDLGHFMREAGIEEWGESKISGENLVLMAKDLWDYSRETRNVSYGAALVSVQILVEMARMGYTDVLPFLAQWFVEQEQRRRGRGGKPPPPPGGKGQKEKEEKGAEPAGDGGSYGGGAGGGPGGSSGSSLGEGPEPPGDEMDDLWDWPDEWVPEIGDDNPDLDPRPRRLLANADQLLEILDDLHHELASLENQLADLGATEEERERWRESLELLEQDKGRLEDLLRRVKRKEAGPRVAPDHRLPPLLSGPDFGGGARG